MGGFLFHSLFNINPICDFKKLRVPKRPRDMDSNVIRESSLFHPTYYLLGPLAHIHEHTHYLYQNFFPSMCLQITKKTLAQSFISLML